MWRKQGQASTCEIQGVQVVEDGVIIVPQSITKPVKLAKIWSENNDIVAFIPLLSKVTYDLEHDLHLVRILLRRFFGDIICTVGNERVVIFGMGMIHEDNIRLYATDVGSLIGRWGIDEFRVYELTDQGRNLWAHPMLG